MLYADMHNVQCRPIWEKTCACGEQQWV